MLVVINSFFLQRRITRNRARTDRNLEVCPQTNEAKKSKSKHDESSTTAAKKRKIGDEVLF